MCILYYYFTLLRPLNLVFSLPFFLSPVFYPPSLFFPFSSLFLLLFFSFSSLFVSHVFPPLSFLPQGPLHNRGCGVYVDTFGVLLE